MKYTKKSKKSRFSTTKPSLAHENQINKSSTFKDIPLDLMPLFNQYLLDPHLTRISKQIYKSIPEKERTKEYYTSRVNSMFFKKKLIIDKNMTYKPFINMMKKMPNLKVLDCSGNLHINKLPDTLNNLEVLNCNNTNIEILPHNLYNLKELRCSHTLIKELPPNLDQLEKLDCSYTYLTYLPLNLYNLKELDCSYTYLTYLPPNLDNLEVLKYFTSLDKSRLISLPRNLVVRRLKNKLIINNNTYVSGQRSKDNILINNANNGFYMIGSEWHQIKIKKANNFEYNFESDW